MTYQLDDNTIAVPIPEGATKHFEITDEEIFTSGKAFSFRSGYGRESQMIPEGYTTIVGTVKTMSEDKCAKFVQPVGMRTFSGELNTIGYRNYKFTRPDIVCKTPRESLISRLESVGASFKEFNDFVIIKK